MPVLGIPNKYDYVNKQPRLCNLGSISDMLQADKLSFVVLGVKANGICKACQHAGASGPLLYEHVSTIKHHKFMQYRKYCTRVGSRGLHQPLHASLGKPVIGISIVIALY